MLADAIWLFLSEPIFKYILYVFVLKLMFNFRKQLSDKKYGNYKKSCHRIRDYIEQQIKQKFMVMVISELHFF